MAAYHYNVTFLLCMHNVYAIHVMYSAIKRSTLAMRFQMARTIESGIPIPGSVATKVERKQQMLAMKPGQSFAVPKSELIITRQDINDIHTTQGNTAQFTCQQYKSAYRCWRVK